MTSAPLVALVAVAFVASGIATWLLARVAGLVGLVDVPNQRSSHAAPTPRGGGLGILFGLVVGLVFAVSVLNGSAIPLEILAATAVIALVGLVDDRIGVPAGLRLAVHVGAAVIVVATQGPFEHFPLPPPADLALSGWMGSVIAVIWIVAMTNVFNFLDGIDGFAGAQGLIGGLALGLSGGPLTSVGFALVGACGGFLLWNWHRARIFMGDVGSGALGFLFAAAPFAVVSPRREAATFLVCAALWLFVFDGTLTIVRRLARGEKIWVAHRTHLYQRLVSTGLTHDQVVLRCVPLMMIVPAIVLGVSRWSTPRAAWSAAIVAGIVAFAYWRWTIGRERGAIHDRRPGSPPR